jgi:D-alanyl-D-alanine carboxypeptidase
VPGAAIGVWTPRGRWSIVTGQADVASGRPVRRDDRFAIRSITKSFVVTLILQLAADGRLSLDDPIARYYPDVPGGRRITLRNLANMTSGLFNYTTDPDFLEALGADPLRSWRTAELLAFALRRPLNFAPGTAYEYSNTNTLLLGEVVEHVTQRRLPRVLQDRILDRLGLGSVRYLTGSTIPPPSVRGYQGVDASGRPDRAVFNITAFGAAGSMASTLGDLRRWGVALAEGSLLPPRLYRRRFIARPATNGPEYDRYGLGIGEIEGWWGHTGESIGFEAAVFHERRRNATVAILLNASNFPDVPARVFRRMVRILESGSEGALAGRPICAEVAQ